MTIFYPYERVRLGQVVVFEYFFPSATGIPITFWLLINFRHLNRSVRVRLVQPIQLRFDYFIPGAHAIQEIMI